MIGRRKESPWSDTKRYRSCGHASPSTEAESEESHRAKTTIVFSLRMGKLHQDRLSIGSASTPCSARAPNPDAPTSVTLRLLGGCESSGGHSPSERIRGRSQRWQSQARSSIPLLRKFNLISPASNLRFIPPPADLIEFCRQCRSPTCLCQNLVRGPSLSHHCICRSHLARLVQLHAISRPRLTSIPFGRNQVQES